MPLGSNTVKKTYNDSIVAGTFVASSRYHPSLIFSRLEWCFLLRDATSLSFITSNPKAKLGLKNLPGAILKGLT
jgi:hypothetical protein